MLSRWFQDDNFAQKHANLTTLIFTESLIHDGQFHVWCKERFEEIETKQIYIDITICRAVWEETIRRKTLWAIDTLNQDERRGNLRKFACRAAERPICEMIHLGGDRLLLKDWRRLPIIFGSAGRRIDVLPIQICCVKGSFLLCLQSLPGWPPVCRALVHVDMTVNMDVTDLVLKDVTDWVLMIREKRSFRIAGALVCERTERTVVCICLLPPRIGEAIL